MEFSHILRPEVQQFIKDNSRQDLTKLLLSGSPFSDVSIQEIAQQIKGRQAAEKKFPFLLQDGIIFPPQLNLEQASSEITAAFKASLFSGESLGPYQWFWYRCLLSFSKFQPNNTCRTE